MPTEDAMPTEDDVVTADPKQQRFAVLRSCEKVLSAGPPPTVREQLGRLAAAEGEVYGLDAMTDVYGNGVVERLEVLTAELLGVEAAVYFPTGTMAQQVALRCWAERTGNSTVALHPLAHPEMHERRAYSALSGLRSVWPTTAPRLPSAQEVRALDEPFGTLALELPLREAGFVLPGWEELTATVQAARERGAMVHFDGARLWESTVHLGRPLQEIVALADSVYLSYYKSLGGISGAVLGCSADFAAQCRAWRHRYGGQLFQQWPAVVSALLGLEQELPKLPGYVAHAKVVAAALSASLADHPGARLHPPEPHTHQFQLWMPHAAAELDRIGLELARETGRALFGPWHDSPLPGLAMTEVTVAASALDWSEQDIAAAMAELLERLG